MLHDQIERFAAQHFDSPFNETMLPFLIDEQRRVSWRGWGYYYLGKLREGMQANDEAKMLRSAVAMLRVFIEEDTGQSLSTPQAHSNIAHAADFLDGEGYASVASFLRLFVVEEEVAA